MNKLVFVLEVLHELEEFNLSWYKVGDLRPYMFKLNVVTAAVKFTFL